MTKPVPMTKHPAYGSFTNARTYARNRGRTEPVWETFRDWHDANPKPPGCEICQLPGSLAMDHNHATGIPRGWLCRDCNLAMGYVGDSPFVIKRMLDYAIDHAANLDAESFDAAHASGLYETFVVEPAREE